MLGRMPNPVACPRCKHQFQQEPEFDLELDEIFEIPAYDKYTCPKCKY